MIIDTNGFEIGDEVFLIWINSKNSYIPRYFKIREIIIDKSGIYLASINGERLEINGNVIKFFKEESDCQLVCDRLNGVSHD